MSEQVVVVGAGQAGFQAAASLRESGFRGRVTVLGQEPLLPYHRHPLSKAYLSGQLPLQDLLIRPAPFYRDLDIEVRLGCRAELIDRPNRQVLVDGGVPVPYDRLILASGARARTLSVPGSDASGVLTLRTVDDVHLLERPLQRAQEVVVIGGGFVGLELASVMRRSRRDVTVVEAQPRILARAVSADISAHLAALHRAAGTRIIAGATVQRLISDAAGRVRQVELHDGSRLSADAVVVGVGVVPNTDLAERAGLVVDDGVVVDERLRTADPAVSAIGDCAQFPCVHAGGRMIRVESVQNAVDQARHVAADICGSPAPYTTVPWFWSDQLTAKLQIAGIVSGHDRTVCIGDRAAGRFSVLCFRDGTLLGVESVNRPGDYVAARRVLGSGATPTLGEALRDNFSLKSALAAAS